MDGYQTSSSEGFKPAGESGGCCVEIRGAVRREEGILAATEVWAVAINSAGGEEAS